MRCVVNQMSNIYSNARMFAIFWNYFDGHIFPSVQYNSEEELLLDFEVMFENAKYYNEEDSQVHQVRLLLAHELFIRWNVE